MSVTLHRSKIQNEITKEYGRKITEWIQVKLEGTDSERRQNLKDCSTSGDDKNEGASLTCEVHLMS